MSVITGKEAMFVNVKITQDDQLLKYNNDVLKGAVRPIQVSADESGMIWAAKIKAIQFGRYDNKAYDQLDPRVFVRVLNHEIGHYINDAHDRDINRQYGAKMREDFDLAAVIDVNKQGEAAYNNWLVAREIFQNNGQQIVVRVATGRIMSVHWNIYPHARTHARHSIACSNRSRRGFVN
ncbi:hypothetical protein LL998_19235 [Burkholderia ambifaria]|uniref:hypothetical protein n=1 Tax=Burkholderia ambifaria TaxID=152480 RepID=UPI001E4A4978|nr:hypothetical protein [Burkholderia ambifaria]UEP38098.1 hypothetical protein LL998_19235 [Burkholderia ambifaria]